MPLVEIALAIGQKAAVTAIDPLIRDLLEVQDRQERELRAVLERLDDLRTAPWRRARLFIAEASQAKTHSDRLDRLQKAYDALFEAYSHFPEATRERATAAIDLAMVMGLLGDSDAARRWARTAFDDQVAAVASRVPQVREALNRPYVKAARQGDFWDWATGDLGEDERVVPPELRGGHSGDSWDAARRDGEHGDQPRTPVGRELRQLGDMVADHLEYREVCASLDPGSELAAYELEVDLSRRRKVRIDWRPSRLAGYRAMRVVKFGRGLEVYPRPLDELRAEQDRADRLTTLSAWTRLRRLLEPSEGALILARFQTHKRARTGLVLATDRRILLVYNWTGRVRSMPFEEITSVDYFARWRLRIGTSRDAVVLVMPELHGGKADQTRYLLRERAPAVAGQIRREMREMWSRWLEEHGEPAADDHLE